MRRLMMVAALMLASTTVANAAPATRPAKPQTYAELKAENERLKAEITQLKAELDRFRPKPAGREIRVGMTLKEAEAIAADIGAGNPARSLLESDSGDEQRYKMFMSVDTGGPVLTTYEYHVAVRAGKITSFTRDIR